MSTEIIKTKLLQIHFSESLFNSLQARAAKNYRTPESEVIFIISEKLGEASDQMLGYIFTIFDKLQEHRIKRELQSKSKAKIKKTKDSSNLIKR